MGLGKSFKKALGGAVGAIPGGEKLVESGALGTIGLGLESALDQRSRARARIGLAPVSQEEITTANLFKSLTPEQQKDLLVNNPNIIGPGGKQFFDPLTNTIRIEESGFQKEQRRRQEALAAGLSGSLSGQLPTQNIQQVLGQLPSVNNEAVTQATFQQAKNLLDPEFTQQRRRLEQQLADQGLPPGSEAFNEQINRLERSQGQQLQQLSLSSVLQGVQTGEAQRAARFGEIGQATQLQEQQRAARFNEISSLLGQAQVGGVGFGQFQPQRSGLDLVGLGEAQRNRQFQEQQAKRDRKAQRDAAIIGAFGSLGSAGIKTAFSDKNLKKNIKIVGLSKRNIPIVEFEYKDIDLYGGGKFQGVLAQDVENVVPDAVMIDKKTGFKQVNYTAIDVDFKKVA